MNTTTKPIGTLNWVTVGAIIILTLALCAGAVVTVAAQLSVTPTRTGHSFGTISEHPGVPELSTAVEPWTGGAGCRP